jgi:hypothetical protein
MEILLLVFGSIPNGRRKLSSKPGGSKCHRRAVIRWGFQLFLRRGGGVSGGGLLDGKLFLDRYRRTTNLARMRSYQLPRHRLVLAEGFKLAFRFVGKLSWRDRPE